LIQEQNFFFFLIVFFISVFLFLKVKESRIFVFLGQFFGLAFLYNDHVVGKVIGYNQTSLDPIVYTYEIPIWVIVFLALFMVFELVYMFKS